MLEVEVKKRINCEDLERLREHIKNLGYTLSYKGVETDIYYSHPCRDFKHTDEALRVRFKDNGECELTYKGPKIGGVGKVREELTVKILDVKTLTLILERLGFREFAKVKKVRETYAKDGTLISIDNVEGLGCFMEIESICINRDVDSTLRFIEELFNRLNIRGPSIRKSYLELLLEKDRS